MKKKGIFLTRSFTDKTGLIWMFFAYMFYCTLLQARQNCEADIVRTRSTPETTGVILEESNDGLILQTQDGKKKFTTDEILSVVREPELANLLTLGDYAKNNGQLARAYYLYKKAFILDPESEKANTAIASLNDYLTKTTAFKDEKYIDFISNYENFTQDRPENKTDRAVLENQAELSQEVIDKFGLVIEKIDDNITVRQVIEVPGSRAFDAGIKNSDILIKLDNKFVSYMGLYGTLSYLAENDMSRITIKLSRQINLWINNHNSINIPELTDLTGFSLEISLGRIYVRAVKKGSSAEKQGMKNKDVIISANGMSLQNKSVEEATKMISLTTPGSMTLLVEKTLKL